MKPTDSFDLTTEFTRRQWLLRLGEAVALAGASGLIPDFPTRVFADAAGQIQLPPGVYDPSSDDLVKAMSGHHHGAPPVGSETDFARPSSTPFQPQFFSQQEFRSVTCIVQALLGVVDSNAVSQTAQWIDLWFYSSAGVRQAAQRLDPLHRALAVAYYGEQSVRDLETADPAAIAREGLVALKKTSIDRHQKEFPDLAPEDQSGMIRAIGGAAENDALRKFMELLRTETIRGYYTSAAGLKELNYKGNAYYGESPGCPAETSRQP